MRWLLDTHILLWSLLEPDRLSGQLATELENPQNELWVSPISVWEIALLAEKKRILVESPDVEKWIREVLSRTPLKEAPLNHEVALTSRTVDLEHQDPADRFIAATALVYDLVLITQDERLLRSTQVRTIGN